ncbi:MAG: hypothetical protein KY410_04540, partial [Proteobacteria bacterium]|nr:hypothetical protein [Pseudomonadota bacterium]
MLRLSVLFFLAFISSACNSHSGNASLPPADGPQQPGGVNQPDDSEPDQTEPGDGDGGDSLPLTISLDGINDLKSLQQVILTAEVEGGEGDIRVSWEQVRGEPELEMDATGAVMSAPTPWVTEPVTLTFQATAEDAAGQTVKKTFELVILPLETSDWTLETFDFDFHLVSEPIEGEFIEEVSGKADISVFDAYGNEVLERERFAFSPGDVANIELPVNADSLIFHLQTFTSHPDHSFTPEHKSYFAGEELSFQEFGKTFADPQIIKFVDGSLYAFLDFNADTDEYDVTIESANLTLNYPDICSVIYLDFGLWDSEGEQLIGFEEPIDRISDPDQPCPPSEDGFVQFSLAVSAEFIHLVSKETTEWDFFM